MRRSAIVLAALAGLAACSDPPVAGGGDGTGAGDIRSDSGNIDAAPSQQCGPACLPGYLCRPGPQGARCVVDPALACAPCGADAQCLGGVCAVVDAEGPFCLIPCRLDDSHCPAGLQCQLRGGAAVCVPSGDSCSCLPSDIGQTRACAPAATPGGAACGASQRCEAAGWTSCVAAPVASEVCNGVDDDCDGQTDEGTVPSGSCAIANAAGACPGVWACAATDAGSPGASLQCQGTAPAAETCNGLDDDCDGQPDEPWRKGAFTYGDDHCGVCGNSCAGTVAHGSAACDGSTSPPHCALASCDKGYVADAGGACAPLPPNPCGACTSDDDCAQGMACVAAPAGAGVSGPQVCAAPCAPGCTAGFVCQATGAGQRCLPGKDACSCTSKTLGALRTCVIANAAGACSGVQQCGAGGWTACSARTPAADVCNGFDDDCDGNTDDDSGAGLPCATVNAAGACTGQRVCLGGAGLSCDAKVPAVDVCNGLDDDCDGKTDPGALDAASGLYLAPAHCGGCNAACPPPLGPHAVATCSAVAGKPTCGQGCQTPWVDVDGAAWNGCECQKLATSDQPDGVDRNCDGVDGDANNAVFVAPTGSDDAAGTKLAPLRSVVVAIAKAKALGKRDIYVEGGSYAGQLDVPAGLGIYGGFAPGFAKRDAKVWVSELRGSVHDSGEARTIVVQGVGVAGGSPVGGVIPGGARIDGFLVVGEVAKGPGASSYAISALGCGPGLVLTQLRVFTGEGAPGVAGKAGADGGHGGNGATGAKAKDIGTTSCASKHWNAGGAGGSGACGGQAVGGGAGGTAICPDFHEKISPPECALTAPWQQTAKAAENGAPGKGPSGGGGGAAGYDGHIEPRTGTITTCKDNNFGCITCETALHKTTGDHGSDGKPGTPGNGGKPAGPGAVASGGLSYKPAFAVDGSHGSHGSGGGGGGAAGGVEVIACYAQAGYHDIGGSGGGGGGGGCGGSGGSGGQSGGGAFGLWLAPGKGSGGPVWPALSAISVVGGKGGPGGAGGSAGQGGYGGFGGKGGPSAAEKGLTFCTSKGGNGGQGGAGGHGGGGGGGDGGPAIGVLLVLQGASKPALPGVVVEAKGAGGAGGAGGSSAGAAGPSGKSGAVQDILAL